MNYEPKFDAAVAESKKVDAKTAEQRAVDMFKEEVKQHQATKALLSSANLEYKDLEKVTSKLYQALLMIRDTNLGNPESGVATCAIEGVPWHLTRRLTKGT